MVTRIPEDLSQFKYLKRVSENEYSAACPRCGGEPHRYGEMPDRFRIWLHSRATGKLMGWCRQCGYIWMPKGERMTPEVEKRWVEERRDYEKERQAKIAHAVETLRVERLWERYHNNLWEDDNAQVLLYERGLTDYWINYWMLGYNPAKTYWTGKAEHTSPTLTIPVFVPGEDLPINIKNRILIPADPKDKYRPEFGSLPTGLFYTNREDKPTGKVLIVEGEFKAMTVQVTIDEPDIYVVGTPGKRPTAELFAGLAGCEAVYILLDPDAYERQGTEVTTAARRMVDLFQERARVMQLPYKVDDMILAGQLDKRGLFALMRNARRVRF